MEEKQKKFEYKCKSYFKEKGEHIIVYDGIVDSETYEKTQPKILVLLKEANHKNAQESWHLTTFLSKGARNQTNNPTWDNVARFVERVLATDENINWEDLKGDNQNRRKEYLKKICAINVKKVPGGSSADENEIKNVTKRDAELLREQIDLCNPNLIICGCGGKGKKTAKFVCVTLFGNCIKWEKTNNEIEYFFDEDKKRIIIPYIHPAADSYGKITMKNLVEPLVNATKEIMKKYRNIF